MEAKKSLKAELEHKKVLFFEIGMIVSLLAVVLCFEYSAKEATGEVFSMPMGAKGGGPITETVPITREPPKGTTRPTIKAQQSMDIIRIVVDETQITTDIDFNDFDMDAVFADVTAPGVKGSADGVQGGGGDPFGDDPIDFAVIEDLPKFMGKDISTFQPWVSSKIEYPSDAKRQNIQGRVNVTFIIEKDGSLSNIEAAGNPLLVAEAIRVIKTSPKWTPGRQRNKPARVKFMIQVLFQIA